MLEWYKKYQREISYFVAGWCTLAALTDFAHAEYLWAMIDVFLVYINIKLAGKNDTGSI